MNDNCVFTKTQQQQHARINPRPVTLLPRRLLHEQEEKPADINRNNRETLSLNATRTQQVRRLWGCSSQRSGCRCFFCSALRPTSAYLQGGYSLDSRRASGCLPVPFCLAEGSHFRKLSHKNARGNFPEDPESAFAFHRCPCQFLKQSASGE